jgi:hypothetical protein
MERLSKEKMQATIQWTVKILSASQNKEYWFSETLNLIKPLMQDETKMANNAYYFEILEAQVETMGDKFELKEVVLSFLKDGLLIPKSSVKGVGKRGRPTLDTQQKKVVADEAEKRKKMAKS